MGNRLLLQTTLEELLGSRNVYYQPPATVKMTYPAIVYTRKNIENVFANNKTYSRRTVYELTVITSDPDSELVDIILTLQNCRHDRHFNSEYLSHDVFTLYY